MALRDWLGLVVLLVAQGLRQGVPQDVNGSEWLGLRAQSAVFLIHAEGLRQAPGGGFQKRAAWRLALRNRMLSHAECERPVTVTTRREETGSRWTV